MAKKTFDPTAHTLVPKHTKVSKSEEKEILKKYNLSKLELPLIDIDDPAIKEMDFDEGDIVKIVRPSPTAKETVFYRKVVIE